MSKRSSLKSQKQAQTPKSDGNPKDVRGSVVSDFDNKRKFGGHNTKLVGWVILAAVIILVGAYVLDKKLSNPNITIGSTTITPKDVSGYANEVNNYDYITGASSTESATKTAENDLILNAALKYVAASHNVKVTQADVDASLKNLYAYYKFKSAYQRYYKRYGAFEVANTRAWNNVYEKKLQNYVIATKNLFLVSIGIDTPYFDSSNNSAELRSQATETLKKKFLPLFNEGLSDKAIGYKTDIDQFDLKLNTMQILQEYVDSAPTDAQVFKGCNTVNLCFNDIKKDQRPGIVSTQSEINSLNKAGQNTGVFTSEAGFIGILRLDSKSAGSYNSWGQFLQHFENKYKRQLARDNA